MDLHPLSPLGSVRVPARPECVSEARQAVRRAADDAGLAPDRVDDLLVAVSEACTNAIEAQLERGVEDDIEVRCQLGDDTFAVEVRDRAGAGFDPSLLEPRPLLTHPDHLGDERGWGVQLMRVLVDRFEHDALEDGTVVRLVFRR